MACKLPACRSVAVAPARQRGSSIIIGPQCQCPHFKPTTLLMRAPGEGAAAAVRMIGPPQWARTLPCAYGPEGCGHCGPAKSDWFLKASLHKSLTEWLHVLRVRARSACLVEVTLGYALVK